MKKKHPPNLQQHTLAIARWEDNQDAWLEGNYLRLVSKKPLLQKKVGEGGTLWIIVSRPKPVGRRLYSLSFRLNNCKLETYAHQTPYGRYAVVGDPAKSTVFAPNDATLVLLSLRFDPYLPIKNSKKIGQSIQTPRRLNENDIQILEQYAHTPDRWSVFISYQSLDKALAERLSNTLQLAGVNVFRDKDSLRGGSEWWPDIERAIKRSRYFVLLMGENTHHSTWVRREIQIAIDHNIHLIPVFAGAETKNWKDVPKLLDRHALSIQPDQWSSFIEQLLRAIGSPITNLDA